MADPGDLTVRRPAWDDLPVVLAVLQAADCALLGESDWTEAGLREEWQELNLDEDVWLVDLGGRLAGVASLTDRGGGRFVADGYVHPELRGRGVGSLLIRLTEARADELARSVEADRVYLQNATIEPDAAPLYDARGYAPVRRHWRMVMELDSMPAPVAPDGVVIRNYVEPDERRGVHATLQSAFADHWESRPRPFDEWSKRVFERHGFDPTLLWVAEADGELTGAIDADDSHVAGDWGYIPTVGVLRSQRRRGTAEALLLTAFAELQRRGETRVALGVDAQSPTGATRLYEKVGMRVFFEAIVYEKELDGSDK